MNIPPLKMKLDVPTRWNTVYTMIDRVIYNEKVI